MTKNSGSGNDIVGVLENKKKKKFNAVLAKKIHGLFQQFRGVKGTVSRESV